MMTSDYTGTLNPCNSKSNNFSVGNHRFGLVRRITPKATENKGRVPSCQE